MESLDKFVLSQSRRLRGCSIENKKRKKEKKEMKAKRRDKEGREETNCSREIVADRQRIERERERERDGQVGNKCDSPGRAIYSSKNMAWRVNRIEIHGEHGTVAGLNYGQAVATCCFLSNPWPARSPLCSCHRPQPVSVWLPFNSRRALPSASI